jgi:hypothetical protein
MKEGDEMKLWLIIACVLLAFAAAQAEHVVLTPSADAFVSYGRVEEMGDVWERDGDINFGRAPFLEVHLHEIEWSPEYWFQYIHYTYINFDLSGLCGAEEVSGIALRLYCIDFVTTGGVPLQVHEVTQPWEEYTITYYNRPDYGILLGSLQPEEIQTDSYISFDLSDTYFINMLNNPELFYGIRVSVEHNFGDYTYAEFHSRENIAQHPPELVIDYTPAAVYETSWGEIKAQDW